MTARSGPGRQTRVLHVILMLGETNGQYNEHCLPALGMRDLSICTYFAPRLTPPPEIALFPGDGTVRGFFRAFSDALAAKEYDVVHVHAPESAALVLAAAVVRGRLRRLRRSLVYTVQDSFRDYEVRNQAIMLLTFPLFARIIFCGHAAYASYPLVWRRLAGRRARVVQNAADLERVDRALERADERADGSFTIVSVGRLERVKDPETLLRAFARVADTDARLVMIGAGRLGATLRATARSLGLGDRVLFTGLVPRDDVFVACRQADVFVSTSRGEGLPVAVIEAMASRCPAILSDIPPHREVVDGAEDIALVPPGDAGGFAEAIDRYRAMPRERRQEHGQRARDHVLSRFGLRKMFEETEAVYRDVLEGG